MSSFARQHRYSDGDDDLVLQDVEDFTGDFYENQPGDTISGGATRKRSNRSVFMFIAAAVLVVVIGASVIYGGKGNKKEDKSPLQDSPGGAPSTSEHETLEEFIASLVGIPPLQDPDSLPSRALQLMEDVNDSPSLGDERLERRFVLACLWLNTGGENWKVKEGWFTDSDECYWYGIDCNKDGRLVSLDLSDNGLTGNVPNEIIFLRRTLLSLSLAQNELTNDGEELAWLKELTNLRLLFIDQTSFAYDGVPPYLSNLDHLQYLDMSENLFSGELDGTIFRKMSNLEYLELSGNEFTNSTIPSEIYNLPNLKAFYAGHAGIHDDLDFIPNMKSIVELWLDRNHIKGTIPTRIGGLTNLASFSVTHCELEGQIPTQFGKLSALKQAWFYSNWFTGSIPTEFTSLPDLKILALEDNDFTDAIMPIELCPTEGGMLALSADCSESDPSVDCKCCTCCSAPCEVVNLPSDDANRLLQIQDEIRRL